MEKTKELIIFSILLVLAVLFFWKAAALKVLLFSTDMRGSDITQFNYPLKVFTAESWKAGSLPLWMPLSYCGFPILGESQAGVFYPPNIILGLLMPSPAAYNWGTILAYFMAGAFMYLYMRTLKSDRFSALFSSIIFMFSGFMILHFRHLNIIQTACFLPLIFFLLERLFERKKLFYPLCLGIVLALQIFAGHFQFVFYSLFAAALYFIFKLWFAEDKKFFVRAFAAALVLGALLSAVQILPTVEYSLNSVRQNGLSAEELARDSLRIKDLVLLAIPGYFGDPARGTFDCVKNGIYWEKCIYAGILPLLLILLYFIRPAKQKIFFFFCGLFLVSIFLAMGGASYLSFGFFRTPSRILLLAQFSLSVMAGLSSAGKKYQWVIIAVGVIDLFLFGSGQLSGIAMEEWVKKPATVEFLEKDQNRIFCLGWEKSWNDSYRGYLDFRESLHPNLNAAYRIASADGYFPFGLRRMAVLFSNPSLKTLGLLNVKYILSFNDLPLERVKINSKAKVYLNKLWMPRVFIAPKALVLSHPKDILEKMERFDPYKEVILEKPVTGGSETAAGSKAEIVKNSDKAVEIRANLAAPGFLVLSDTYYPGWRAYVDGKEAEILRANYVMRGVMLEQGAHRIRFVFDPPSFKIGLGISLAAWLGIILAGWKYPLKYSRL